MSATRPLPTPATVSPLAVPRADALVARIRELRPLLEANSAQGEGHRVTGRRFGPDRPAAPEATVVQDIADLVRFQGLTEQDRDGAEHADAARLFPRLSVVATEEEPG